MKGERAGNGSSLQKSKETQCFPAAPGLSVGAEDEDMGRMRVMGDLLRPAEEQGLNPSYVICAATHSTGPCHTMSLSVMLTLQQRSQQTIPEGGRECNACRLQTMDPRGLRTG